MFSEEVIRDLQHNYVGFDVSNRVKALEAYRIVSNRLEAI